MVWQAVTFNHQGHVDNQNTRVFAGFVIAEAAFPLGRNPFGVPPEIIIGRAMEGGGGGGMISSPGVQIVECVVAQSSNNHCAIASYWLLAALLSSLLCKLIELQCLLAFVKYPLHAAPVDDNLLVEERWMSAATKASRTLAAMDVTESHKSPWLIFPAALPLWSLSPSGVCDIKSKADFLLRTSLFAHSSLSSPLKGTAWHFKKKSVILPHQELTALGVLSLRSPVNVVFFYHFERKVEVICTEILSKEHM